MCHVLCQTQQNKIYRRPILGGVVLLNKIPNKQKFKLVSTDISLLFHMLVLW